MSRAFYTVHAIRHRAFLISPFYPSGWSTTPFVRHEFSTRRSSRSSRLDHPLCVACVVVYPSPSSVFFSFIPFLVEITKCGENGSSLLKSEHRSLLCFLFPFRCRGRRKMAFREYTLTGMEISLPLFFFFFILGRCFAFPFLFFLPFLSFVRSLLRSSLYFYSNRLSTSAFPVFFVLYYESWAYSLHFGLAMRRVE